jgi:[protein-PII] uridylyltransferase
MAPEKLISEFLQHMPNRYFLTVPDGDIKLHFDMMGAIDERPLVCRHRHFPDLEFSEFMVVTRDQPGLFSRIAGALTTNNLNILSARITTRDDGIALDVFRVSHLGAGGAIAMDEDRWPRVERDLERVLSGEQDIATLVAESHKARFGARKFVRRVETEVTIDNRSSEEFTVIDVFTQDRVGLLFAITYSLFQLGMKVHVARISTNADQALDVFYISDRQGNKVTDLERMRSIRSALVEQLEADPGAVVQSAD